MPAPSLCDVCRGINYSWPCHGPEYEQRSAGFSTHLFYKHHDSLNDLKQSADCSGCGICSLLAAVIRDRAGGVPGDDDWEILSDFKPEPEIVRVTDEVEAAHAQYFCKPGKLAIDPHDTASPIMLDFAFRDPFPDELISRCTDISVYWTEDSADGLVRRNAQELSLVSGLEDTLVDFLENRDEKRDTHTGSRDALNFARFWIDTCGSDHARCLEAMGSSPPPLPTRVVDVGSDTQQPSLHISGDSQRDRYAILSHCWGKGKAYTTTTTSIDNRQGGLELDEMPKTFREAIHVARHLGFRYLWIDSLCIVQDSASDWQSEAREMGRYYRDSSLCICAVASASDEEGFFHPRDAVAVAPCRSPMFDQVASVMKKEPRSASFIQRISHHRFTHDYSSLRYFFAKPNRFQRTVGGRSALNTRGWTLQEWLLSPRSLLFEGDELLWICPSMETCECKPEGMSNMPSHTAETSPSPPNEERGFVKISPEAQSRSQYWVDIMEEFSRRSLTFGKDKLPAVAGLASEFSRRQPAQYYAGLWDVTLRQELWWSRGSFRPDLPSAPPYRAPSWSWASVDGEFRGAFLNAHGSRSPYADRAEKLLCDIVDCWTEPLTEENPFGEVVTGALTLRGRLRRARVGSREDVSGPENRGLQLHDEDRGQDLGLLYLDNSYTPSVGGYVWCIPLVSTGNGEMDLSLGCLALAEATGEEKRRAEGNVSKGKGSGGCRRLETDVFRRVGIVYPSWATDVGNTPFVRHELSEYGTIVPYLTRDEKFSSMNALLAWFEETEERVLSVV